LPNLQIFEVFCKSHTRYQLLVTRDIAPSEKFIFSHFYRTHFCGMRSHSSSGFWLGLRCAFQILGNSAQWQEFHPPGQVFRLSHLGNHFQIADALPNRHCQLMAIDDPGECYALALAQVGLGQEITVLRKDHPIQRTGTLQ
jgi:hypothetical protein